MKQNQINFLNMAAGTIAEMRSGQPLWADETEIATVVNAITSDFDTISTKYNFISGTDLTSYTASKDNTFDRIIAAVHKLNRKLSAFAKTRNDAQLLPLVDLSITALSRGIEANVISHCEGILTHATARLANLATFKVTEDELTYISNLIAEYKNHSGSRSVVSSDKSNSGKEISDLISKIRENFDILDDLVEGLIDDETFIARYKSVRAIKDYGVGKTLKNKEKELTVS